MFVAVSEKTVSSAYCLSGCVCVRAEHQYPSDHCRRPWDRPQGPLEVPGALSAPLQIRQSRAHTHGLTRLQLKRLSVGPRAGQSFILPFAAAAAGGARVCV